MGKLKKAYIAGLSVIMAMSFSVMSTSAETISDGLSAQVNVTSQNDSSAEIDAQVDNTNYYGIDGISVHLSVSDNAEITGDTEKIDLSLDGKGSEKLKASVTIKDDSSENISSVPDSSSDSDSSSETDSSDISEKDSSSEIKTPVGSITLNTTNSKTDATPDTGAGNDSFGTAGIIILLLLGGAVVTISVKKRDKRFLSLFLSFALVLSFADVSVFANEEGEDLVKSFTQTCDITIGEQTVTVTIKVDYPAQAEIHDNSIDDLKKLNSGNIDVTYNSNNEITFINGKYTDYKVTDSQTALNSVSALDTLLGLKDKAITVLPFNTKTADNGDVYYSFKQIVGVVALSSSYITVGADKDGNTLCVSNSLDMIAQATNSVEDMITAEQAKEKLKSDFNISDDYFADVEPELDNDSNVSLGDSNLCWVFYLKGSDILVDDELQQTYQKVFVDVISGDVVSTMDVTSIKNATNANDADRNNAFFNIETTMMEFTDYDGNKVSLPVAQDDDGKYFICDTQRKMVGVDTAECVFAETSNCVPYTFDTPENLSSIFVSAFKNMQEVYDLFAEYGIRSVDGAGIPIKVGFGYSPYGKEVANACNFGTYSGWSTFAFSNFELSTCFDVAAHEFTHGVQGAITGEIIYSNETGAIAEAYADIIGNIVQHMLYPDEDEKWELAEDRGNAIRCMSDPHTYFQPEYVGDNYFAIQSAAPSEVNDMGGVHKNSSILSKVGYDLIERGMTTEESFKLWTDTLLILNPQSTYKDIYAYLRYLAGRNNLGEKLDIIINSFEKSNIEAYDGANWDDFETPEGSIRVTFNSIGIPDDEDYRYIFMQDGKMCFANVDSEGECCAFINPGEYELRVAKFFPDRGAVAVPLPSLAQSNGKYTFSDKDETLTFDVTTIFSDAS